MINFGKYNEKVIFQGFSNTSDGAGGILSSSYNVLTTFARVTQIRGNNAIESQELVLPNTYEIAIQFRNSFTPSEDHRILYRSKYYKIISVRLDDQRQHKEYVIQMIGIQ